MELSPILLGIAILGAITFLPLQGKPFFKPRPLIKAIMAIALALYCLDNDANALIFMAFGFALSALGDFFLDYPQDKYFLPGLISFFVAHVAFLIYLWPYGPCNKAINILGLDTRPTPETTSINVQLKLKVCNNGKKVIIGNKTQKASVPNPALINALKLAHEIKEQYLGSSPHSLTEIAASMNTNKRQIWRNLKMAFLAPDIQLAILSGTQPPILCIQDLLGTQMSIDWNQQRTALGFNYNPQITPSLQQHQCILVVRLI